MNWEAIGAVAELLGAIGVIASLAYLATQIRQSREQMAQNTRATRASAYQQFRGLLHGAMMAAGENPERERGVILGMADFRRLSEEDAFRFTWWITGVAYAFENAHYQYRVGMLDDDRWQKHYADVGAIFQNPGVAQWFLGEEAERDDRQ